ncbi:hypothetical protein D3C81_1089830 [compost metagenome]
MRAGQQRRRFGRGALVAADHVAGGIAPHRHAGLLHPFGQLGGGAVVGLGQVGAGEHAGLLGVDGQGIGPGHDARAYLCGCRHAGRRRICCHACLLLDVLESRGGVAGGVPVRAGRPGPKLYSVRFMVAQ